MAEERDIFWGASEEVKEYAKKCIDKMGGMMAQMAKAVYEKYGPEAIEVIAEEVRKQARVKGAMFKDEAGYKGKEDEVTVDIALRDIYAKSHGVFGAGGFDLRRVKLEPEGSESHTHYCSLCEGWKTTWPEGARNLCYIFSTIHDVGFMEGVNPKLKWEAHAENEKDSEEQRGLSSVPPGGNVPGKDSPQPCIMKLKLMD